MFRLIALALGLALILAWSGTQAQPIDTPPFDAKAQVAIAKMRQFCAACHAVGNVRFIRSEDDHEVWQYIHLNRAPTSQKLWVEGMIEVLSWPSDVPPPFDQPMDPRHNRDWMPKGAKRLSMAGDTVEGIATRKVLLEALKPQPGPDPKSE